jgi:hypothetical protein
MTGVSLHEHLRLKDRVEAAEGELRELSISAATKPEITPEMIEAGVDAMRKYAGSIDLDDSEIWDLSEDIIRRTLATRSPPSNPGI